MRVFGLGFISLLVHGNLALSRFWGYVISIFAAKNLDFSRSSMVSGQFCFSATATAKSEGGLVNQREGQIITEYLAVLVESRIECETTVIQVLIF